ncbi:Alpha/Beta hydrolase protein [Pelagophyceae sp. CCMP2097]|nr:Alpha/Beta hydrolase protein [Pelagophyceae sp. CCMP2097]
MAVPAPAETRAHDIMTDAANLLGVEPRHGAALGLYFAADGRLEARVPSALVARNVQADGRNVVLAVRLFTEPVHSAALRGLRARAKGRTINICVFEATDGGIDVHEAVARERRSDAALARLVYAQTVAGVSAGSYALLPSLGDAADDSDGDVAGARASASPRAAAARLRFGALRLWSRALDFAAKGEDVLDAARRLLIDHSSSTFAPHPAPDTETLLAALEQLLYNEEELEAGETHLPAPEADYVELAARSPAHGCALFACTLRGNEAEPVQSCWLAVSRRGAAVLSADARRRIADAPFAVLRRWDATDGASSLRFEREAPPDRWPAAFKRNGSAAPVRRQARESAEAAPGVFAGLLSLFEATPDASQQPEDAASKRRREERVDCFETKVFDIDIESARGGAGSAEEAAALLDDYALCDLASSPPRFSWEKTAPDASGAGMAAFYDALVLAVVRPPRFDYESRLLGPSSFTFCDWRYHRKDAVIVNDRGERLHCSRWHLASPEHKAAPTVVFVHANSASRAQACHYLSLILSLGCALVSFDCAGSGLSDGDHVTLGLREARDLRCVLHWLHRRGEASDVAVWGQSMGAVAGIYYQGIAAAEAAEGAERWPALAACVLDSPYADFEMLAKHVANERKDAFGGWAVPDLVLDMLLSALDATVLERAGFSPLADLRPLQHASRCRSPALFVRARNDPLITQAQVEALASAYAGARTLALVEGSHSSARDADARKFISRFLARYLTLPPIHARPGHDAAELHLECAPWQRTSHRGSAADAARDEAAPDVT